MAVKIVFFDALFTLVQPRLPIFEQYHRVLTPYLGPLDKTRLKASFKVALGQLQTERPAYGGKTEPGEAAKNWWAEVIRRTALGAGADVARVDEPGHLDGAVHTLLHVFSSKEGYKFVDGAFNTISTLNRLGVKTGLVSNSDSRILKAFEDLGAMSMLNPALVSELEGIEKPDPRIWDLACRRAGVTAEEAVHVGDEYNADAIGASQAGLRAVWFRPLGVEPHIDSDRDIIPDKNIIVVETLSEIVGLVDRWNSNV